MNTFILDKNILQSARYLDFSRLHKQAVEIKQILLALAPASNSSWKHHPATKQWRDFPAYLASYGAACVAVWRAAGYKSSLSFTAQHTEFPEPFHQLIPYHRAYMLSKYLSHYRPLFPEIPISIPHSTYLSHDLRPFQVRYGQRVAI